MNTIADLKRLGAIRTMPEMKAYEPYPETAQPQNDMVLRVSAGNESTFEYRHTEAQNAS